MNAIYILLAAEKSFCKANLKVKGIDNNRLRVPIQTLHK